LIFFVGGATYANAYNNINIHIAPEYREFSMSVTGIADSLGILCAGLVSLWLEPAICDFQVSHGNDLCLQVSGNYTQPLPMEYILEASRFLLNWA